MTRNTALPEVTVSEHNGVRYLHLGTPWVQGAMRMSHPNVIELEYVRRMMCWMLWRPSEEVDQGLAVQLGLGAAAITRFCRQVLKMRTVAVELNPRVIQACRGWFRLPQDDDLLQVICGDAGQWIASPERASTIDTLQVDLYDQEAASPVLDDGDFYRACHDALAPGGVMAVNLFGRDSSFERSAGFIAQAFGSDQVWRVQATREGNTVVIATRGVKVPDAAILQARADALQQRYGLPALKWLRMVSPLRL